MGSSYLYTMDKIKILVVPANDGGCAYYRAWAPFGKLAEKFPEALDIRFNKNPLGLNEETGAWEEDFEFEDMKWCDIIFTQNICNFGGEYTARVIGKAREFKKFIHYDTDELYEGHRLKGVYEEKGLSNITKFLYNNADLVTVTQRKFAERVQEFCGGVLAVVKNCIDYKLDAWNHTKVPHRNKRVVRVGWAGGIHHEEDVKEFAGIPALVNTRVGRENVEWHFFGKPPLGPNEEKDWQHDVWQNYKRILLKGFKGAKNWFIHSALPSDQYGVMFAHMDIAIAPLQMNAFNDSKSEIKVAECGRYKVPLIASNVGCYDETIKDGKTGYLIDVDASKRVWVDTLSKVIKNKNHREQMGENLHTVTEEYFDMNKVVDHRIGLYTESAELRGYKSLAEKFSHFFKEASKLGKA